MDDDRAVRTDGGSASPEARPPHGRPPDRCPDCGARRPDGISWCSQCYVDLSTPAPVSTPEPVSTPAPPSTPAAEPAPLAPAPAPLASTSAPDDPAEVDRLSEAMLAQLAAAPPRGRGASLAATAVDGRLATTVTVTVGALLVTLLGVALMYLFGALL